MGVNSNLAVAAFVVLLFSTAVPSQEQTADQGIEQSSGHGAANATSGGDKNFEDLSQQEKDAAKATARSRKIEQLRVCADPGNMPFSNNKQEGFENKIAEVLAAQMGAHVSYAWRPTFERGLTRQPMSDLNLCDVMLGLPSNYEALLMTTPLYRSTYVFAYRKDKGFDIKNLSDPILKKLRIGVYETSGIRNALATHGVKSNIVVMGTSHDADLVPEHQPWHQVEQVVTGELDIAAVWGPFAGWVKEAQHAPIVLKPTNLMDDDVPMEFSVGIGVRQYDAVMKYALEDAMEAKKQDIANILATYGVPLVQCSECLISGDIPAHGDYILEQPGDESEAPLKRTLESTAKVETWLKEGANVNDELDNAVLSADLERVKFLLKKGANINNKGNDGEAPLHIAATNGDLEMIALLLDRKADVNLRDGDGYTALTLAAARNKTKVIELLKTRGADLEAAIPGGYTPLFVAIGEGKYAAAKELIDAGAKCTVVEGPQRFTLLMAVATQRPPDRRIIQLAQGSVGPVDIAQLLVAKGNDVNAVSAKGITALMIAAAHDNAPLIGVLMRAGARTDLKSEEGQTALDIAMQNGSDAATRTLRLLQETNGATHGAH